MPLPFSCVAYQDFAIAEEIFFYKLPLKRMNIAGAAPTIPVATRTAADGLVNNLGLAQAFMELNSRACLSRGGGASTFGVAALQLAKAAGHGPVLVTASLKDHLTLKALGADICFDARQNDVGISIWDVVASTGKR